MAIHRDFDVSKGGAGALAGRLVRPSRRRTLGPREVATGSLACPSCDAPIALARPTAPPEPLACGFCDHAGELRDFLTLGPPTRPARVVVRIR